MWTRGGTESARGTENERFDFGRIHGGDVVAVDELDDVPNAKHVAPGG